LTYQKINEQLEIQIKLKGYFNRKYLTIEECKYLLITYGPKCEYFLDSEKK
jgi:hypothetical protein